MNATDRIWTWRDYTAHVLQSLPADGPGRDPLALFAWLAGEVAELQGAMEEEAYILEAGDVLFLVAALERVLMLDLDRLDDVPNIPDVQDMIWQDVGNLGHALGKHTAIGAELDPADLRMWLNGIRSWTLIHVRHWASPAEVMAANAKKLDEKWGRV